MPREVGQDGLGLLVYWFPGFIVSVWIWSCTGSWVELLGVFFVRCPPYASYFA